MAPLRVSITKSEWLPDDLTAFVPLRLWKSPFITTWDGSQNQNHPTDSADQGEKAAAPQSQAAQYNAEVPKTILELQQFRRTSSISIRAGSGREGMATLVNLNPAINTWYLLSITWSNAGAPEPAWHLENPKPY